MNPIKISINTTEIKYTMQGGMGASWHAISDVFPLNNEQYSIKVRETAPLGSAHGGNPPVSNIEAWNQIKNHASWLGMNFIRVELSQHMYNPEKNKFDWENEEMQALYHILNWAKENNADVFLQQMCANVEWNTYPGIHPLISAPKNVYAYVNAIATLLEFLTEEKGYTCIKYFCMTNEPPGGGARQISFFNIKLLITNWQIGIYLQDYLFFYVLKSDEKSRKIVERVS